MRARRMTVQLLVEEQQLLGRAGQRQSQPPKKSRENFISARESLDCEIHNDLCDR